MQRFEEIKHAGQNVALAVQNGSYRLHNYIREDLSRVLNEEEAIEMSALFQLHNQDHKVKVRGDGFIVYPSKR